MFLQDINNFNEINDKPSTAASASRHFEARRPSPRRGLNTLPGSRVLIKLEFNFPFFLIQTCLYIFKETGFTDGAESFKDNYYSENQYTPLMGSMASSLSSKEEGSNGFYSKCFKFNVVLLLFLQIVIEDVLVDGLSSVI